MAEEVKVLGNSMSFYALRVRIALELKGVDYEYVEEDLSNKSPLLLESNPVHKKVPVLLHNGKSIAESLIILQYIDQTWDGTVELLPKDPYDRAMLRFWAAFMDGKALSFTFTSLAESIRAIRKSKEEDRQAAKEAVAANFGLLEEAMATTFSGKPFFGGETVGFLDIALGAASVDLRVAEKIENMKFIDPHKTPLLYAWIERFQNVDCVKKLSPDFDKKLAHVQQIIRSMMDAAAQNNGSA
eukprot:Gb_18135 [translate_table: standard]